MIDQALQTNKSIIAFKRCIIAFILFILLYRWYSHLGLSQILNPPLKYVSINFWYQTIQYLGIDQLILSNKWISLLFDGLTFLIFSILLWKPQHRLLSIIGVLLLFIYSILSPMYMAFSAHYFCAIIISCTLLLTNNSISFSIIKEGLRFYIIWIYFSSFVWKVLHGIIFDLNSGLEILKSNMGRFIYYHSPNFLTNLYQYIFRNEILLQMGVFLFFILEASFIVGFFTKKWDKFYLILIPVIHFTFYFFVDTLFIEWMIFMLFFIPNKYINNRIEVKNQF